MAPDIRADRKLKTGAISKKKLNGALFSRKSSPIPNRLG